MYIGVSLLSRHMIESYVLKYEPAFKAFQLVEVATLNTSIAIHWCLEW